ncbi:MAG: nucleotide sugar dehydrogenase [Thermodesulfobacteriota bacterium]
MKSFDEKTGIFLLNENRLKAYIQQRKPTICVIGLGRVGLPAAISFALKGFYTIGVDINQSLVDSVNKAKADLKDEPELGKLLKRIRKGYLTATSDTKAAVSESEIILLCLPTPLNVNTNDADYSYLQSACKQFDSLKKGSMICVESTVSPRIIENMVAQTIERASGLKAGIDFGLAACPERVNPSQIMKNLYEVPRIIGGINKKSTNLAAMIYENVFGIHIVKVKNCMTANAVKLTENVFRYINIAYVTELAFLFERMGIDIGEVIDACKTKWNFVAHYPSVGVGGSCLPVNMYQLLNIAAMGKGDMHLLEMARRINEKMPLRMVDSLEQLLSGVGKSLNNSTITVLGVTYKPNVADARLSPVEVVIQQLKAKGAKVRVYDPMITNDEIFSCKVEKDYINAAKGSDAILIGTPHDKFRSMNFKKMLGSMSSPVILDPTGFLADKLKKYNVKYGKIGERLG